MRILVINTLNWLHKSVFDFFCKNCNIRIVVIDMLGWLYILDLAFLFIKIII